jgi:hypothetical protein
MQFLTMIFSSLSVPGEFLSSSLRKYKKREASRIMREYKNKHRELFLKPDEIDLGGNDECGFFVCVCSRNACAWNYFHPAEKVIEQRKFRSKNIESVGEKKRRRARAVSALFYNVLFGWRSTRGTSIYLMIISWA